MARLIVRLLFVALVTGGAHQRDPVLFRPTTTLLSETANNTSASASFRTQPNGNAAPGNVSKIPIQRTLYAGSTTRIFAQFQAWFGEKNHMDVGYRSDSPDQVRLQVADMLSRGISGVVIDWYGPQHVQDDQASILVMKEAERRAGQFYFAIEEDKGAIKSCGENPRCDVTGKLIKDINYIIETFARSPAYIRSDGRPIVPFFDPDRFRIDWLRVRQNVHGNPLFLFRDAHGFKHAQSDGAYCWRGVATSREDAGLNDLDRFYSAALTRPSQIAWGAAYKGFDDSLAAWGKGKYVAQHCAETWLSSLQEASRFYSSERPLSVLQVVTWNDYEEGTEIETGIDNCVSVEATLREPSLLTWELSGPADSVDHFTIFLSADGEALMSLGDVPNTARSFNLPLLIPGSWRLRVKAVGKPSIMNHMTNEVSFTQMSKP